MSPSIGLLLLKVSIAACAVLLLLAALLVVRGDGRVALLPAGIAAVVLAGTVPLRALLIRRRDDQQGS